MEILLSPLAALPTWSLAFAGFRDKSNKEKVAARVRSICLCIIMTNEFL
jgi:hypothetical protein